MFEKFETMINGIHIHKMHSPCKYGINLHISSPKTKSRSSVPTNVNGIQKTPKNKQK